MSYICNPTAYGFCKSFIHSPVGGGPPSGYILSTNFGATPTGNGLLNLVMFG